MASLPVALAGCEAPAPGLPPGQVVGASQALGHRLRDGGFPEPGETRTIPALIVGGGVAGLSAAWWLGRHGFAEYELLELEPALGGNSRFGESAVSAYPWGAHYLPLPGPEARELRLLLADLGVLTGDPAAPRPEYNPRYLCFAPQERLYRNGAWQEGLHPQHGLSPAERDQFARFGERIETLRQRRDKAGRPAFAIPVAHSATDADLLALDRLTMRDWLLREGLDAQPLHWLVNYACRDDYGTDYSQTSAWAALHYFAARAGHGLEHGPVLTWPEGNGWLVRQMQARMAGRVHTGTLVYRITPGSRGTVVDAWLPAENRSLRWQARQVVLATPVHVAARLLAAPAPELVATARAVSHAPWLVANLHLSSPPAERHGQPLCWDNVLYDSASVGYVVATHQRLARHTGATVLTWYRPLSELPPGEARLRLQNTPREAWARQILADLALPHPDLAERLTGLDIMRWGHAMARPEPGFLTQPARRTLARPGGPVHLAHSDLSGFSIFEEAHWWGVQAGQRVLAALGAGYANKASSFSR